MKTKLFLFIFLIGTLYFACEDSALDTVGMGMRPGDDFIVVKDTTFNLTGKTVTLDSIYAKSNIGYLGKFYDNEYGEIKSGYMCQYFPSLLFELDSMVSRERGFEIDSVRLDLYYFTYTGDSLTPMEVTVYPLKDNLEKNYYTNKVTKDIVDFGNPWGKQTYTARNLIVSDSVNNANAGYYYKQLTVWLPRKIGQDLFEKVIADDVLTNKNSTNINKRDRFVELFPGNYFESTFGTGNILDVERTRIVSYYTRHYTVLDTLGVAKDSIGMGYASYMTTKEVTLVNTFENKHDEHLLVDVDSVMYIKAPGSVYSQISIPIPEIIEKLGKKKLSSVELVINTYEPSEWEYALSYPGIESNTPDPLVKPRLLLIPQDSIKNFFESQTIADSRTSYATSFSSANNSYTYSNISNIVQKAIDEAPDQELELLLVPIQVNCAAQTNYYGIVTGYVDYASSHDLQPSAVALRKGGNRLQVKIVAADLEINQ